MVSAKYEITIYLTSYDFSIFTFCWFNFKFKYRICLSWFLINHQIRIHQNSRVMSRSVHSPSQRHSMSSNLSLTNTTKPLHPTFIVNSKRNSHSRLSEDDFGYKSRRKGRLGKWLSNHSIFKSKSHTTNSTFTSSSHHSLSDSSEVIEHPRFFWCVGHWSLTLDLHCVYLFIGLSLLTLIHISLIPSSSSSAFLIFFLIYHHTYTHFHVYANQFFHHYCILHFLINLFFLLVFSSIWLFVTSYLPMSFSFKSCSEIL